MVEAWPFPYLPLGALLEALQCDQDILKAALNGIDALLARDFRPIRWELQVLDLRRDAETNFWHVWAGLGEGVSANPSRRSGAAQPSPERRGVGPSSTGEKQQYTSMEVLVLLSDLCFMEPPADALLPWMVKRVKQNKLIPRLCCRNLEILDERLENSIMHRILEKVELARVEQVDVNCDWNLVDLASFVPFLGRLPQMFKYLQAPLETLSITNGGLMECDLKYLSMFPSTSQLRRLNLSHQQLTHFNPHYLHTLLERTSATLENLNLGWCRMTEFQFTTILPALGQCSRLHCFRFPGNCLRMAALENVLRHVLSQCKIRFLELSLPVECGMDPEATRNWRAMEDWQNMLRVIEMDLGVQLT
ncbi:PREDICTED: melanoma antigen preferentially expressed in tumors-like, partial [Elephantulus edwardii]|uniref:melanoma antigen preferentially expressed in tumors-like n=1 Tax=Elephantulus edwardii TaxID=28737 RepID=UPI0003F076E7